MASIIRPKEHSQHAGGVAFQFSDMTDKAKSYLESVQAEARRIIDDAQREAKAVRQKAEQEGRAAAMAELDRAADQKIASHVQSLMPALQQVVEQLAQARHAWLNHWEKQAVHLAAQMAARIARREAAQHPEVTLTLIREALELAAGSANIRLYLSPNDRETLGAQAQQIVSQVGPRDRVEIIADRRISPGGCRVETQFGVIDQQFEAQLARIEEELA